MKPFIYPESILPLSFSFPSDYQEFVNGMNWPDIEPWTFLALDMPSSLSFYGEMLLRYPDKPLIPFAKICDLSGFYNDGYVVLACFDGCEKSMQPIVRIYDFSRPKVSPWENLSYATFNDWLAAAKAESANYKDELAELEHDE